MVNPHRCIPIWVVSNNPRFVRLVNLKAETPVEKLARKSDFGFESLALGDGEILLQLVPAAELEPVPVPRVADEENEFDGVRFFEQLFDDGLHGPCLPAFSKFD